jgi:hypothetical protein
MYRPNCQAFVFKAARKLLAKEESTPMTDRVEFIPTVCFSLETSTIASAATSHSIPNVLRLLPVIKS